MNRDNVVPFEHPHRAGLARRGSPDKLRALIEDTIELECPRCAAVLCLDAARLLPWKVVLCASCDSPIAPEERETADRQG
ncbi:MAG: hypothetical protein ABR576_00890 [Thermoanaerobaculia bacterium]